MNPNVESREGVDPKTETFFSSSDFVHAWCLSSAGEHRPLAISIRGSGPPRTMYAIQAPQRYGSRVVPAVRPDFYLSPGWNGKLRISTLGHILRALMSFRTRSFGWVVRFDHQPLAEALALFGLAFERIATRVTHLDRGYESVFARYSATIRNHVRKSHRRGVRIRETMNASDIAAYYELYRQRAQQKRWVSPYPLDLTLQMARLAPATRFLVAEHDGEIIGGALFARDGCSVYLFHSAFDPAKAGTFPIAAVYDAAIQWACEIGASFFNFGGSGDNGNLEHAKALWGTRTELNWRFEWINPIWRRASDLRETLRRN
jgi:Acetyltransferase (GNAT) domain